jgi:hypothetical protein
MKANNGVYKANCDANLVVAGMWSLGVVIRDEEGHMVLMTG